MRILPGLLILGLFAAQGSTEPTDEPEWKPLFDGKTLSGWASVEFGAQGSVAVEDGAIQLHPGAPLTGVRFQNDLGRTLPDSRDGYELRVEARRVSGADFFCGLTFPVGTEAVTLICGGWGGGLVGLSCLDGLDASENDTTTVRRFERGRWYRIRVRVTKEKIEAWIGDERLVSVKRSDHEKLTVRSEVAGTVPLGISAYQTHGAVRKIEVRRLPSPTSRPARKAPLVG